MVSQTVSSSKNIDTQRKLLELRQQSFGPATSQDNSKNLKNGKLEYQIPIKRITLQS